MIVHRDRNQPEWEVKTWASRWWMMGIMVTLCQKKPVAWKVPNLEIVSLWKLMILISRSLSQIVMSTFVEHG